MKLEHNVQAYKWSTRADREAIIIAAGEYKIVKRETTDIGEEKVWLEHTTDAAVYTSAPLIARTKFGRTPLGIALDGDVIFTCKLCGKGHPSVRGNENNKPYPPSSLSTKIGDDGVAFPLCLDPRLCRR